MSQELFETGWVKELCFEYEVQQSSIFDLMPMTRPDHSDLLKDEENCIRSHQSYFGSIKLDQQSPPEHLQYEPDASQVFFGENQVNAQQPVNFVPTAKYCFVQRQIKLPKNHNLVKFLLRELLKYYYSEGVAIFRENLQILNEMNAFMKRQKYKYKDKKFQNNLNSMSKFFDINPESRNPRLRSFLARKMAHQLIRKKLIPSMPMGRMSKKMYKSYLFGLKMMQIRCRNPELMKRTKIC